MGGTAGMISNSLCLIDKCCASGNIKGASAVAGIAGCPWSHENDGADNSSVITISNCAYCGNTIEANTPASSGYFGAGGILGWNRVAGTTNIFNCVSRVRNIKFPSLTASKNLPYGVGGIIGYTSVAKGNIGEKTNVAGCYSDIARSGFLIDGEALPEGDKDKNGLDINYGGVFGLFSSDASSGGTTLSTVFHNPEVQVGADNHALKSSDAAAYTTMDELLTALNGYAAVSSNETWVLGADGFPIQAIFKDEVE